MAGGRDCTDRHRLQTIKRGGGGVLRLLWWQAPTMLNPHFGIGQKDLDAARIFYEPWRRSIQTANRCQSSRPRYQPEERRRRGRRAVRDLAAQAQRHLA